MQKIFIIHGPNLNLLKKRPTEFYGNLTLSQINEIIKKYSEKFGIKIKIVQSNSESEIIDFIQKAEEEFDGIIINPAAYTHTSIAIRDCIEAIEIPVIEVHLSNIYSREEFRQKSLTAAVCLGVISGFGYKGYLMAIDYFIKQGGEK